MAVLGKETFINRRLLEMDSLAAIGILLVLSKAWTTFIQVPENGTYSVGSNILLKCVTQEENVNIIWKDLEEGTIIFIGKGKYTSKQKYRNFEISPSPRNYSLTINDASPNDEGSYSCQDGDIHRNARLTIEALPTLALCVNKSAVNAPKPINLTVGDTVVVSCKAKNIGPNVFLELKYGTDGWIKPKSLQQDSYGSYFNMTVTDIHVISITDSKILCRAIGTSEILQSEVTTELLYKPTCKVEVIGNDIQCICNANPPVKEYKIVVNGEAKSNSKSIQAKHYVPANFSCLAVNDIGVGQSEVRYVLKFQGAVPTAVIVTGSAVCCLSMMCFILWRKKRQMILFISPNSPITSSNNDQSVMTRPEIVDRSAGEISMPMNGTLDIYEKIYASVPMDKIIMFNEVKMISRLKKSVDMERWLGMLKSVERVVVSSPTEIHGSVTSRTDWAAYVKKLLDLPSVTHIVNIRGVCIEEGRFYVIQEYVPNGTLTNHLISLQSKQSDESSSIPLPFLELASSLLHGIDFIRRKEFYHPGLSSDKVLITTDNKCKLYDFCTADMVKDKISYILEKQKEETICQVLPPEAVFQRSYDDASDMWSLAFTLWEIFSYGKIPMLSFRQSRLFNKVHLCNIPDRHEYLPASIFQLILQCWNVCSARRPTVKAVRMKIDKELSLCQGGVEKNEVNTCASEVALYEDRIYSGNADHYEVPKSGNTSTASNHNYYSETRLEVPAVLSYDESYEPMSVPTLVSDESDEAMATSTDDKALAAMS